MKEVNNKVGIVNMGFATGSEATEGFVASLYKGIAPIKVLAVNPGIETLKKWYPTRDYEKFPVNYKFEKDGEAPGIFVTFYVQADAEHKSVSHLNQDGNFNFITRCAFLIKNEAQTNRDGSKIQVINAYGDTAWMLKEEWESKQFPAYMAKINFITDGIRIAYVGEESLIKFLKTFINIPDSREWHEASSSYRNKTGEALSLCRAAFSPQDMAKIVAGNVSPVSDAIKHQPNNRIKLLFGVRTTSDNKQFQDVCTRLPIKFWDNTYTRVFKELNEMLENGSYASTDFGESPYPFIKHEENPTSFSPSNEGTTQTPSDPFGNIPSASGMSGSPFDAPVAPY